jgi:hypothetical protein
MSVHQSRSSHSFVVVASNRIADDKDRKDRESPASRHPTQPSQARQTCCRSRGQGQGLQRGGHKTTPVFFECDGHDDGRFPGWLLGGGRIKAGRREMASRVRFHWPTSLCLCVCVCVLRALQGLEEVSACASNDGVISLVGPCRGQRERGEGRIRNGRCCGVSLPRFLCLFALSSALGARDDWAG